MCLYWAERRETDFVVIFFLPGVDPTADLLHYVRRPRLSGHQRQPDLLRLLCLWGAGHIGEWLLRSGHPVQEVDHRSNSGCKNDHRRKMYWDSKVWGTTRIVFVSISLVCRSSNPLYSYHICPSCLNLRRRPWRWWGSLAQRSSTSSNGTTPSFSGDISVLSLRSLTLISSSSCWSSILSRLRSRQSAPSYTRFAFTVQWFFHYVLENVHPESLLISLLSSMTLVGHSSGVPEESRHRSCRPEAWKHHDGGSPTPAPESESHWLWLGM